jgi:hypothetical protein
LGGAHGGERSLLELEAAQRCCRIQGRAPVARREVEG